MKKIFLALLIHWAIPLLAQKPEPIYSFARVQKSLEWYKNQALLWKSEVKRAPKNGIAWYNYYRVSRNLNRCDTTDARPQNEKAKDLQQLVAAMGKALPNSYEYNLCQWLEGGNDLSFLPYLKKAVALGDGRLEHLGDVVVWAETERNLVKRDETCRIWKASGEISPGMMYYNYNVLSGLPKNALLFTSGDNDTFPCWMLQSMGVRKDVTVLNTSLLRIDAYREKVFAELGIEPLALTKAADGKSEEAASQRFDYELIQHCTKNSDSFPVCVSLTTSGNRSFLEKIEANLYLTGLAYEYRKEPMDNMANLRRNFEQNYALDYLDKFFYPDMSQPLVQEINRNYLVPMLKLYDHYQISGETARQSQLKSRILAICKGTKEEQQVINHLNKADSF